MVEKCLHKTTSTKTENGKTVIHCEDCHTDRHAYTEICPQCGAHKANYREMMGRECYEEHGKK